MLLEFLSQFDSCSDIDLLFSLIHLVFQTSSRGSHLISCRLFLSRIIEVDRWTVINNSLILAIVISLLSKQGL